MNSSGRRESQPTNSIDCCCCSLYRQSHGHSYDTGVRTKAPPPENSRPDKSTLEARFSLLGLVSLQLSKLHINTTNGLRRGTQFDVPLREELVTVCVFFVGLRGDARQVK